MWTDNLLGLQGCGAAMVLDSSNFVHIASVVLSSINVSGALFYTTNRSGAFESLGVDNFPEVASLELSIAMDANGHAHISYQDQNKDLKYATNASGAWQYSFIAANGSVGAHSQIRVDSMGKVHIAYTDETSGTVKLAIGP